MKETLTTNQIADRLYTDQYAGWTYNGAKALAEYLEEYEEATGEEIEFDCCAIRSDYSEYESALEAAEDCGFEPFEDDDDEQKEESALKWLQDHTTIVEFNGGVIVQAF